MNRSSFTGGRIAALPLALVLAFAACDPATDLDDHADAEGIAISLDGTEAYTYFLDDGTPGTLAIEVGTYAVEITFLDHDGDPLAQDEDADEAVVEVDDSGTLTWTASPEEDPTVIDVQGTLGATEVGTGVLEVCLPHEGHCDFEAFIPVTVTAAQ